MGAAAGSDVPFSDLQRFYQTKDPEAGFPMSDSPDPLVRRLASWSIKHRDREERERTVPCTVRTFAIISYCHFRLTTPGIFHLARVRSCRDQQSGIDVAQFSSTMVRKKPYFVRVCSPTIVPKRHVSVDALLSHPIIRHHHLLPSSSLCLHASPSAGTIARGARDDDALHNTQSRRRCVSALRFMCMQVPPSQASPLLRWPCSLASFRV